MKSASLSRLQALEIEIVERKEGDFELRVPRYRYDVTRDIDGRGADSYPRVQRNPFRTRATNEHAESHDGYR